MVERTRQGSTAPLLIVDIALPRDVEHAVGGIEGVRLRDIDDLNSWAARGIEKRSAEVGQVRAIVADEVSAFLEDQAQRQAAPLVAQLREHFESVRAAEVARLSGRLNGLDDDQRDAVDAVTRAIVAKLLHSPSVRLREAAGSAPGERLSAAVRDLFDLD
jgi:glutamyl-tRNA reductase